MHKNYTLKQAVKAAIAIFTMSAQANALALGLGNIEVNSHLGQPLRASIKVQGASELSNLDCFRVINDDSAENQLNSANFKLSKVVDDVAILTVTTNQVLNEPIMNLSIATECEVNMRRDYVLLLDPPLSTQVEGNMATSIIEVAEDNQPDKSVVAANLPVSSKAAQTIIVPKTNKKPVKPSPAKATKKDIVLTAGYTDIKPVEPVQIESEIAAAKNSKPRLNISAGDTLAMPSNNPQLRMDTQLQFTPENAPVSLQDALAGNIEINDEVTAINNRMAHLKKQIDSLAQTNQTLKAENQVQLQQLEVANSAKMNLDWLGYLIGGSLFLSSISITNKWRMRRQDRLFEEAQFASTSEHGLGVSDKFFNFYQDEAGEATAKGDDIEPMESDTLFAQNAESQTPFSVEEFGEEQNILDHADVFLSHGRTSLAIQLLQNHLIDHPKKSVTEWLFLLDLLAKENMQAVYEQTALECKEYFNIRIPAFSNDEGSAKLALEDFPRLIAGLEDVWGTPAAQVYLDDLIYNSRLETRVGFEKSVLEELLLLKSIANEAGISAQVIQLDDKKLALKAQKEAKLAADKEERIRKVNELIEQKAAESKAQTDLESKEALFEFTLAEYN